MVCTWRVYRYVYFIMGMDVDTPLFYNTMVIECGFMAKIFLVISCSKCYLRLYLILECCLMIRTTKTSRYR